MSGELNPSAEVGRGSARQFSRLYRGGKGVLQGEMMTGLRVVGGRAVCTGVPAVTECVCDCHCAFVVKNSLHRELVKGTPVQVCLGRNSSGTLRAAKGDR